jgi:hypothetical protein
MFRIAELLSKEVDPMTDVETLTKRSLRTFGVVWTLIACPLVGWGAWLLSPSLDDADLVFAVLILPAILAVTVNALRRSRVPALLCHAVAAAAVCAAGFALYLYVIFAIYGPPFT